MDDNIMQFANRTEFRAWLEENCQTASGIWLLFGKAGGPETLTAGEALEEAFALAGLTVRCRELTIRVIKNIFPHAGQTASGQKRIRLWSKNLKPRAL